MSENKQPSAYVKFLCVKIDMVHSYDIKNQTFAAKAHDTQTSAQRLNMQTEKITVNCYGQ
jgi:hypothetical protein